MNYLIQGREWSAKKIKLGEVWEGRVTENGERGQFLGCIALVLLFNKNTLPSICLWSRL